MDQMVVAVLLHPLHLNAADRTDAATVADGVLGNRDFFNLGPGYRSAARPEFRPKFAPLHSFMLFLGHQENHKKFFVADFFDFLG
jgi:hypothetical protein